MGEESGGRGREWKGRQQLIEQTGCAGSAATWTIHQRQSQSGLEGNRTAPLLPLLLLSTPSSLSPLPPLSRSAQKKT